MIQRISQVIIRMTTCAVLLSAFSACESQEEEPEHVRQILDNKCFRCHQPKELNGNLDLTTLGSDFSKTSNAAAWVEIKTQIELGEMPPEDEPQLSVDEMSKVSGWISAKLKETERLGLGNRGKVLIRRLNRQEYVNTVTDLLQMRFPTGESPLESLPPDGTAFGFNKVSAALTLDPSLLTLYYQVARRIAERAIVDGPPKFPTEKMRLEYEEMEKSNAIGYLLNRLGMKTVPGGIQLVEGNTRSFGMLRYPGRRDNNVAPQNGFYRFTVRASGAKGEDNEVPRLLLTHSHPNDKMRKIMEFDVTNPWDAPKKYSVVVPRDTLGGELQLQLVNQKSFYMSQRPGEDFMRRIDKVGKQGDYRQSIQLAGRKIAEGWGGDRSTPDPNKLDESRYPRVFLDYLEVEGPLYEQWPPKSHTTLLFGDKSSPRDMDYARRIFSRFLPRAWRRPVNDSEQESILKVVKTELENGGSFNNAIRMGLTATLTSPRFLYLVEPDKKLENKRLTQFELASRLSYFLWNSMPDERLFELARKGELDDAKVLRGQVERMVRDQRFDRWIEDFGRQWLKTETFNAFAPDKFLYRSYDETLGEAIEREPIEFLRHVVRNQLSALNFIDSDFVVINRRLAKHYGIKADLSEKFQQVQLSGDSRQGGLLAMAGIHLAGSDGVRTKPVARAVYVRDVLFNDPPDPPPPNAGEIEPNIKGEKLTVRERLIAHQQIKSCAICHRSLDPYGLALENFNVIGNWRERQDGEDFRGDKRPTIDASGKLPNGEKFANFREFRDQLFLQKKRFRRGLAEKVLVYALGRPVEPTDDPILETIVKAMEEQGDTFESLMVGLVTSRIFREK